MTSADLARAPFATAAARLEEAILSLATARRRQIVRRLADAGLVALVCGLAAVIVAWGTDTLLGWHILPPSTALGGRGSFVAVGALVGVAVFVVAVVIVLRRTPSVLSLARRADRVFGLDERLSTAIEVADRPTAQGAILGRALLADAARRAAIVRPAPLSPRTGPTAARAAAALAAAVIAGFALASEPGDSILEVPQAGPEASVALSAAEMAEVRQAIADVAALIAADADARSNPYLAAVAERLGAVGETAAGNDSATIAADLAQLAAFAAEGYAAASADGAPASTAPQMLDALIERLRRADEGAAPGAEDVPPLPAPPDARISSPAADEGAALGDGMTPAAADRLVGTPPPGDVPAGAGDAALAELIAAEGWGELDPALELAARELQAQLDQSAFVAAAGAAQNAGRGAGDMAGDGNRPLFGPDAATPGAEFARADEVLLPAADAGGGARMRVEAVPDAALSVVAATPSEGNWSRLAEAPVRRPAIGNAQLDAVRRYFTPDLGADVGALAPGP